MFVIDCMAVGTYHFREERDQCILFRSQVFHLHGNFSSNFLYTGKYTCIADVKRLVLFFFLTFLHCIAILQSSENTKRRLVLKTSNDYRINNFEFFYSKLI